jgi:hypothetical protein
MPGAVASSALIAILYVSCIALIVAMMCHGYHIYSGTYALISYDYMSVAT